MLKYVKIFYTGYSLCHQKLIGFAIQEDQKVIWPYNFITNSKKYSNKASPWTIDSKSLNPIKTSEQIRDERMHDILRATRSSSYR